jgi:diaminohydroxyphosphoribosylaminopyrimidine deaminase/5-amino-6-(5-phosphoribosylamino)uracil reductase
MTSRAAASSELDAMYMRRALALAERGWGHTAPNPMVGAVVVAEGRVVGEGYHARYGGPHAEVMALRQAGDAARGATVYVTLEPCAHFGKTPPCADALVAAGVARVVIAAEDPSTVARGGAARLREAGMQVDVGVQREAAVELNAPFFNAIASPRPWLTLKLALSADGAVADPNAANRWITGPEARAEVHRLRANADAVAVGIGTVLADDPSLTVRDAPLPRVAPLRVVFDSSARTPLGSVLVRTARDVPTVVVAHADAAPEERVAALSREGVTVVFAPTLRASLEVLRDRGVRSIFAEPGPTLAGALLREGLVDRLIIFRAPRALGADALRAFAFAPAAFESSLRDGSHRVVQERRFGDDVMSVYALHEVPCSPG